MNQDSADKIDEGKQAEPFKEMIEAFRKRVILKGGSVEEHYVLRKINDLESTLKICVQALETCQHDCDQNAPDINWQTFDWSKVSTAIIAAKKLIGEDAP
jgi:hypothetical protein